MTTGTMVFLSGAADEKHACGWAAILRSGAHERILSGCEPGATAFELELHASIEALSAIREGTAVRVIGASASMTKAATEYIPAWKKNEWLNKTGEPIKQVVQWQKLSALLEKRAVEWMPLRSLVGQQAWSDTLVRAATLAEQACDDAKDATRKVGGEAAPKEVQSKPVDVAATLVAQNSAAHAGGKPDPADADVKRLKSLLSECLMAISVGIPVPIVLEHAPDSLAGRVAAELMGEHIS